MAKSKAFAAQQAQQSSGTTPEAEPVYQVVEPPKTKQAIINDLITATSDNLKSGMTQAQASKVFGVHRSTIKRRADKAGLGSKDTYTKDEMETITKGLTPTAKAEPVKMETLKSASAMARDNNMKLKDIQQSIKDLGIEHKARAKYDNITEALVTSQDLGTMNYDEVAQAFGYKNFKELMKAESEGEPKASVIAPKLSSLLNGSRSVPVTGVINQFKGTEYIGEFVDYMRNN